MNTPVVMLLNVVFWSFGVSAAILAGLIWLDRIVARKQDESPAQPGLRLDTQALISRIQQPSAPRRRGVAQATAKAA
jgi:hypothetical protein